MFPTFPASQAHLAHQTQQSLAGQPQIGQRKQRHDLPGVLRESAVANLHKAKLALDDTKRMFNDRANRRQHPVEGFLFITEFAARRLLGRSHDGEVTFLLEVLDGPIRLVITPVAEGDSFFTVQKASSMVTSATLA